MAKGKTKVIFSCILIAFFTTLLALSCQRKGDRLFKETRHAMYTITSLTVVASTETHAKGAIEAAFNELKRLEAMLNYYSKHSEVSQINQMAGIGPVKVSKETLEIVSKSLEASRLTEGGFDITVGPLIALWDFEAKRVPLPSDIKRALKKVGYKELVVDTSKGTVFLQKRGMEINLGGIIKGYAAHKATEVLKARGIKAGIVSVGGDIQAFGHRPDGKGWNIGIQEPRPKVNKDEIIGSIAISDRCISSSGDYEKYFEQGDKRYHHILNPTTGFPAEGIRAITVVATEGALCDALATGLFVLGVDRALQRMVDKGIEGLIIDDRGQVHMTPWFRRHFIKKGA